MDYTPKTDEELKELALGLREGRIFCSAQIRNPDDIYLVFMPLGFLSKEDMEELRAAEITFIYEELSKSMPRSINGMPMFGSMAMLNKTDHQRLRDMAAKIEEALAKL